jgi:Tetracyclin repressor-like, C-terminal domain
VDPHHLRGYGAAGHSCLRGVCDVITARLLLGMCIWVSRWFRPDGPYDADRITEAAISLARVRSADA